MSLSPSGRTFFRDSHQGRPPAPRSSVYLHWADGGPRRPCGYESTWIKVNVPLGFKAGNMQQDTWTANCATVPLLTARLLAVGRSGDPERGAAVLLTAQTPGAAQKRPTYGFNQICTTGWLSRTPAAPRKQARASPPPPRSRALHLEINTHPPPSTQLTQLSHLTHLT